MALSFAVEVFTKPTAPGTVTVTPGFQIKGVRIYGVHSVTAGTYVSNFVYSVGLGSYDGSTITQRCVGARSVDAAATSDAGRGWRANAIISIRNQSGSTDIAVANIQNITSTSFDVNFTSADATASKWIAECWGGTDITNCKLVTFALNTATGNQDITTVGFQGDFAFFIGGQTLTDVDSLQTMGYFAMGHALSSTKRGSIVIDIEHGRVQMDTWRQQRSDRCLLHLINNTGAVDAEIDFVSWLSNGFRINVVDGPASAWFTAALVFKGGQWDCGALTSPTAGGLPVSQDTTTAFTPKGAVFQSQGFTANTAIQVHSRLSIGAAESTSAEASTWSADEDNALDSVTASRHKIDKVIMMSTPAATMTSSTTQAEADLGAFATNKFTLSWSTIDASNAYEVLWVVFQDTAAAANNVERALTTETISISEAAFTRLAAKIRTRTDTAITVGETRARLAAKNRALATQTTALSENIIRIKGKVKSLATEAVTIGGGTLARLLVKIRTALDTTTISETRQRLGSKSRPLSPPIETVALSESVQRIKSKIKTLATETITLGAGTAVRLSSKIRAISLQTIILTDNRTRLKAGARTLAAQTVGLSENIARTVARQVTRALATQSVGLSDTLLRRKAGIRTISQTIILTDTCNRLTAKLRILAAQTITLADNIARLVEAPTGITRALLQTVALSDSVSRRLAVQRTLIQTSPTAESLARVRGVLRTLSQNILVSESRSRIKSASRTLLQTLLSSDSITKRMTKIRAITQTIIIAENVVGETVGNLVRSLVQTVIVSDSIARRAAKLVILAQTVTITEQVRRLSTKLRTIPAQTITLSDSTTQELNVIIKNAIKTISQTIAITEHAKIEVVKKSQRFRKILQPSIKRLISNHPAWLLGTRGMHNDYEEFSP